MPKFMSTDTTENWRSLTVFLKYMLLFRIVKMIWRGWPQLLVCLRWKHPHHLQQLIWVHYTYYHQRHLQVRIYFLFPSVKNGFEIHINGELFRSKIGYAWLMDNETSTCLPRLRLVSVNSWFSVVLAKILCDNSDIILPNNSDIILPMFCFSVINHLNWHFNVNIIVTQLIPHNRFGYFLGNCWSLTGFFHGYPVNFWSKDRR